MQIEKIFDWKQIEDHTPQKSSVVTFHFLALHDYVNELDYYFYYKTYDEEEKFNELFAVILTVVSVCLLVEFFRSSSLSAGKTAPHQ